MTSLWKLRILSRCLVLSGLIRRKDGTLNRKVSDMFDWAISTKTKSVDSVATFDEVVDSATGVWVRLFVPTQVYACFVFPTLNGNWKAMENLWLCDFGACNLIQGENLSLECLRKYACLCTGNGNRAWQWQEDACRRLLPRWRICFPET